MKQINIREALLELDRKTDARYDLTTLYEACKLDDDDKQKLVKYIDAYDHPATINKFLSSKCDAITEALGDDDVSDMKIIDEINDGGDRTLWNLMDKFEDEDLQLKELTEDVDPEVLEGRLEDINFVMSNYVKDSFLIDDVQGSGKDWKVTYNDVTVDVTFDTDWEEYTYYINGKGPYAHSSYEYIASDIANFVDYNHLGQSDDEVDEALGDNRDIHTRTHMDSYDVYCTDCGQVTSHRFKGNFKDGEKELGRYICKECGCENDDDPINESLTEDVDTSNLEPQIKEVVNAFMAEVGYEADEIEAYTAVEIKDTVDDMVQVEVRAELGYDDLMELCDKLNPIVAALDHFAYFEPVTSGIARAFIRNDQSQDIVDEDAVNQWTNKIYDCASMEDLRQVWTAFKDHIDNGQYTDGTVDAVLDVIHKKADMLNESLTEDAKEEYFVGDDETGRIYYNEKDAQAAFDSLKKSGVANPVKMKVTDMREDVNDGWVKRWDFLDKYYKDDLVISKISSPTDAWHVERVAPNGHTIEHLGNYNSLEAAKAGATKKNESKLTLNESDDTDILYDMEDYDEDNTTVTAGNSFIEDGHTWTWFRQCGDIVHLDFDNWAVWWAYRPEVEDDEDSAAISGFFVVDTDTGFIDWGPCDTVKEAQEFLQSKVNDWENDDIDESKSISEEFNIQDYYNQTLNKFNNIHSNVNDDYDTFETGVELAIQDLTDETNKSELFRCDNKKAVKTFTDKLVNTREYDTLRVYPEVKSGYYDVIDYLNRLVNKSKSIKEDVEVIYQKGNKKIIKDGYGYAIDDGINANRFYVTDDGEPKFDDGCSSKFWLDKVNSLIKAGKLTSRKNESKSIKEGTFHWSDNKAAYEAIKVKNALKKAFNTHVFQDDSQNLYIPFNFWGRKDAEKAGVTIDTVGKFLNSIGYKYAGKSEDDEDVYNYLKDDVKIELYEVDSNRYAIHLDFDSEVDDKLDIDTTSFSSYVNTDDVDAVQDLLLDIVEGRVKTLGDIVISEEDIKNIKELCGRTLDMYTYDFAGYSDDIVDKVDDYFAMKQYQELHNKHVEESKSIKEGVNSAANSLFDLLKDYGAISVDKDVDVTRISFRNSEDDSDATLVHHCILSKGYKELNQYGNNPNVTEYLNEAGDTCVKLLIYDDSIAVELSAEDSSQYMESVDKDLTHCTECGKKLNDKGYCETEGCPNGTLKEGVEKYIIIAKEDGLNLYYNATDDNFGTDMKAATQYEERAVALDDYKAVKDRYPTAYIRSTYDIPPLNKPSKKEGFEEDEWDDDELASIYGGDTKNDMPDGVETPEETEARLAKENGR